MFAMTLEMSHSEPFYGAVRCLSCDLCYFTRGDVSWSPLAPGVSTPELVS